MEAVSEEDEIKLTEEELEAIRQKEEEERRKREEEERQREEEERRKREEEERKRLHLELLNKDVEDTVAEFNQVYDRTISILCTDLNSMKLDIDSDSS